MLGLPAIAGLLVGGGPLHWLADLGIAAGIVTFPLLVPIYQARRVLSAGYGLADIRMRLTARAEQRR